jgi:hypothetical protein
MLHGISLICFGTSYGVTLILEASRLWFRAPARWALMMIFAVMGLATQTIYLALRANEGLPGGLPLSSWHEWCLIGAWVLAATYIVLAAQRPESPMGIFILPLVEALIGVAWLLRGSPPFDRQQAQNLWGMVHGLSLLLGMVAVMLGFVAGLMYLVQSYRLKHKLPPRPGFKLPSLEWLQQLNERSLVISSLLLLAGIGAGAVFNVVRREEGVAWTNPVVLISGGLAIWLVAALVFNGFYRPARQGRKVAYLTVASFIIVMLVLTIVWTSSGHAEGKEEARDQRPEARERIADCGRQIAEWNVVADFPLNHEPRTTNLLPLPAICNLKSAICNHLGAGP